MQETRGRFFSVGIKFFAVTALNCYRTNLFPSHNILRICVNFPRLGAAADDDDDSLKETFSQLDTFSGSHSAAAIAACVIRDSDM